MATTGNAQTIGFVTALQGSVTVTREGITQVLEMGDAVFADDVVITGDLGTVSIEFVDGSRLDMGRNDTVTLDTEVFDASPMDAAADALASADAIKAAILAGEDPTALFEATAAGGGGGPEGAANAGSVILAKAGQRVLEQAGFETRTFSNPTPDTPNQVDATEDLTISISDGSAVEGNEVIFTITLDEPSVGDTLVTINVYTGDTDTATAGTDYLDGTYTLIIPAGSISGELAVPSNVDNLFESDETFTAEIVDVGNSNPFATVTPSDPVAVGTIIDNDTPTVSIDGAEAGVEGSTAVEGNPVVFQVNLSNPSDQDTEVTIAVFSAPDDTATQGVDYSEIPTYTVIIPAGQTSVNFTVDSFEDPIFESSEDFSAQIIAVNNPNGTVGIDDSPATGIIVDNDTPTISIDGAEAGIEGSIAIEGDDVVFQVDMSNPSDQDTTIQITVFSAPDDTATQGVDYSGQTIYTVVIPAGATSASFNVGTFEDSIFENSEDFSAVITSVSNPNGNIGIDGSPATGIIIDNDTPTVNIAGAETGIAGSSAVEGNPVTFEVSITTPSDQPTTVTIAVFSANPGDTATQGVDYSAQTTYTVVIPAGETSVTFDVATFDDSLLENAEDFSAQIIGVSNPNGNVGIGDTPATGWILDNDVPAPPPPPVPTLGALQISDAGTVPEGEDLVFQVNLSLNSGTIPSGTQVTVDLDWSGVLLPEDFDPAQLPSSLVLTVTGPTGASGQIILSSITDDQLEGLESILVSAPTGSVAFDGVPQPGISGDQGTGAVIDGASVNFADQAETTVSSAFEQPGAGEHALVFTVSMSEVNNTGGPVVVYFTLGGQATAGGDFDVSGLTPAPGQPAGTYQVEIPNGGQTVLINLPVSDDPTVEVSAETVEVTLTGTDTAGVTASDTATGTITDLNGVVSTDYAGTVSEGMALSFDVTLNITSGTLPAGASIEVPLDWSGVAGAADFSAGLPTSVILTATDATTANGTIVTPTTVTGDGFEGIESVLVDGTGPITVNGVIAEGITAGNAQGAITDGASVNFADQAETTVSSAFEQPGAGGHTLIFTVSMSTVNSTGAPLVVYFNLGGQATAGVDYDVSGLTPASGQPAGTYQVEIPNGGQTVLITLPVSDDPDVEVSAETVTVTLTGTNNSDVTADDIDSGTITDLNGLVTIADAGTVSEGGTLSFDVTLNISSGTLPAGASIEVPLDWSGVAGAADFSAGLPTSVILTATNATTATGTIVTPATVTVDGYEGIESVLVDGTGPITVNGVAAEGITAGDAAGAIDDGPPPAPTTTNASTYESDMDLTQDGLDLAPSTVVGTNGTNPAAIQETVTGPLNIQPGFSVVPGQSGTTSWGTWQISNTGVFTYTLINPANHSSGDVLDTITYQVTDDVTGYGITNELVITIVNDIPIVTDPDGSVLNLAGQVLTGLVDFDLGADGEGGVDLGVTATPAGLTSNDAPVSYTVVDGTYDQFVAYTDDNNSGSYDAGEEVFTIGKTPGDSEYQLQMYDVLDLTHIFNTDYTNITGGRPAGSLLDSFQDSQGNTIYALYEDPNYATTNDAVNASDGFLGIQNNTMNVGETIDITFSSDPDSTVPEYVNNLSFNVLSMDGSDGFTWTAHLAGGGTQSGTITAADIVNGSVQINAAEGFDILHIEVLGTTDSGGFKLGDMSGTTSTDLGDQMFSFTDTVTDSDGDTASGSFDITIGDDLTTFLGVDDDGSTTGN